ncbi:MAG: hypothetical protein J0M34_08395 [Alphaproteobacteria bacterium]|nr:hypothetical protein [Alphaproteobacteria bacterium]
MPSEPQKTRRYKAKDLNRPIIAYKKEFEVPPLNFDGTTEEFYTQRKAEFIQAMPSHAIERSRRFLLLLEEYNIEAGENRWLHLAMALANDYVPGLQIEYRKKPGRKDESAEYILLYFQVRDAISKSGKKPLEICQKLNKTAQWSHVTAKALYQNYLKAKKSPIVIVLKALEKEYGNRIIPEFEKEIAPKNPKK